MPSIATATADQFERACDMLRAILARYPDPIWREGERPGLEPARWALHTVETVDFYLRESAEGFRFGSRFSCDWEGAPIAELPSPTEVIGYLGEVRRSIDSWIRPMSAEELLSDTRFPWTGSTLLEQLIYALRHTLFHAGELNMRLRLAGVEGDDWM